MWDEAATYRQPNVPDRLGPLNLFSASGRQVVQRELSARPPLFLARTKADPLTVSPPAKMFRLPGAAAIPDAHVSSDCPAARRLQVPGPDDLHLAIVEGRNAFMALETAWNDLHRRAGQPHQVFLSFN